MQKPDLSLNYYHAHVVLGSRWLDAKLPGWEKNIDLERLNMRDCCRCILGQVWGNYSDAVEKFLFIEELDGNRGLRRAFSLARTWGFALLEKNMESWYHNDHWNMLQEAWVYEVLKRRPEEAIS